MDAFHQQLARLALDVAEQYGFVLAGGYALQAHGFLSRRSEDVDLFTSADREAVFPAAVASVLAAYAGAGLSVETIAQTDAFARLRVEDRQGRVARVELGVDWRGRPPISRRTD